MLKSDEKKYEDNKKKTDVSNRFIKFKRTRKITRKTTSITKRKSFFIVYKQNKKIYKPFKCMTID